MLQWSPEYRLRVKNYFCLSHRNANTVFSDLSTQPPFLLLILQPTFQRLHNCALLSLGNFRLVCSKLKVLSAVTNPPAINHNSSLITTSLSLSSFNHLCSVPLSGMCLQNLLSVELHPSGFKNSTGRLMAKELRGLDKPFLDEPVRVIQFNH